MRAGANVGLRNNATITKFMNVGAILVSVGAPVLALIQCARSCIRIGLGIQAVGVAAVVALVWALRRSSPVLVAVLGSVIVRGSALAPGLDDRLAAERTVWGAAGTVACACWTAATALNLAAFGHILLIPVDDQRWMIGSAVAAGVAASVVRVVGPRLTTAAEIIAIGAQAHELLGDALAEHCENVVPLRH